MPIDQRKCRRTVHSLVHPTLKARKAEVESKWHTCKKQTTIVNRLSNVDCSCGLLTAYRNTSSLYPTVQSPNPPPLRRTVEVSTIPHDWHNRVRNDPSRPSKVDGSRVIWKVLCYLLVINRKLGPFSPFMRYGDLSVEKRICFLPYFCSTQNLKMFSLHWIAKILCVKNRIIVWINEWNIFVLINRVISFPVRPTI